MVHLSLGHIDSMEAKQAQQQQHKAQQLLEHLN